MVGLDGKITLDVFIVKFFYKSHEKLQTTMSHLLPPRFLPCPIPALYMILQVPASSQTPSRHSLFRTNQFLQLFSQSKLQVLQVSRVWGLDEELDVFKRPT